MPDRQNRAVIRNYLPEKIAFLLYLAGNLFISHFHEPWFDEAVAWDIARDTSVKDILFYVPHYESHPQFWHLLLVPFAKLGAPYELTLTLINLLFAGAAVALLLRYAPIARPVKLLLPFTYFLFYQYGIISRPYSVMMLAFVLLAMCYPERNRRPGRYVLCLILLCATSAYGMLLAGGITLVWLLEIWHFENIFSFLRRFLADRRFYLMLALLLFALFLAFSIAPAEDNCMANYMKRLDQTNNLLVRGLYMFLVVWADVTCTNVLCTPDMVGSVNFLPVTLLCGCLLGALILAMILLYARRRKTTLLFLVPAALFCGFSSSVYVYNHHIGIALLFGIFWYWVSALQESAGPAEWEKKLLDYLRNNASPLAGKFLRLFPRIFVTYCLAASLYWTVFSCVTEIRTVYSNGRSEARFIKENHLEDYNIWSDWYAYINEDGVTEELNVNRGFFAYSVLPYFDRNIFSNHAYGTDGRYTLHVLPDEAFTRRTLDSWHSAPMPDILVGELNLKSVFTPEELSAPQYVLIFSEPRGKIWKDMQQLRCTNIYMRKELAEELGFETIDVPAVVLTW